MSIALKHRRLFSIICLLLLVTSFCLALSTSAHADMAITKNVNSNDTRFTITTGKGIKYWTGAKKTTCWITNCSKNPVQVTVKNNNGTNVPGMVFQLNANQTKAISLKGSGKTFYVECWRYACSGNVAVWVSAGSVK